MGGRAVGQNLFDEDYVQVAFDAPLQGTGTTRGVEQGFYTRSTQLFGAFLAEPRTFGLTLRTQASPRRARRPAYVAPPDAPVAPVAQTQTCPDGIGDRGRRRLPGRRRSLRPPGERG